MVYLGNILPPKNQKVYLDDVALAVKNYEKDLLSTSFEKLSPPEQQKIVDAVNTMKPPNAPALTTEDYVKLLNNTNKLAETQTLIWNSINKTQPLNTTKVDIDLNPPTERMYPTTSSVVEPSGMEDKIKVMTPKERAIDSAISAKTEELKRPLTAEEKIDIENKVNKQGLLSSEIMKPKPTPSEASTTLTIDDSTTMATLTDEIQKIKDLNSRDSALNKLEKKLIKQLFKREIKNGITIYGATSNAQKEKNKDLMVKVDSKGDLVFSNGKPLPDRLLSTTLKLNIDVLEGKGFKGTTKGKGMSAANGEKNFGEYHISLPALRKGNLTIYRPKSNSVVVARRNMTPTLLKIINDIKGTMKFDLNDYDRLKKVEQKTVDHVINLLRMDYPPKMKRALDEENWNLKQRYEILISEINAGNGGYLVVSELKDILGKLKENKVINKRKYDMIMSALE